MEGGAGTALASITRTENHESDLKLQPWVLILTVTERGSSHTEFLQMLLSSQEQMNILWDVPLIHFKTDLYRYLFQVEYQTVIFFLLRICSILVLKPKHSSCILCKLFTKMGNSKQDRTIFTDQILDFKASDPSSICILLW